MCSCSVDVIISVMRQNHKPRFLAAQIRVYIHQTAERLFTNCSYPQRAFRQETAEGMSKYSICAFVFLYVIVFIVSFLIISFDLNNLNYAGVENTKFMTGFSSVAATLNNIGPGLGAVGPAGSFAAYSWWSKLVFIFDMLAGRLEILPMLLLFAPSTWRR